MYNFTDTNEAFGGVALPTEALKFNGEYIENQIKGYRTLTVRGRESLSSELDYYELATRDGAVNKSKRYPPRTITVKYQLITKDAKEYRDAYNKLGYILSAQDAKLIFNDEPDKFFTGTVTEIGEIEEGKNAVVGEFEIFCADPFKYSIIEYEAVCDRTNNTIFVDYGGTYRAFPKLCADFHKTNDETSNGECGFIAFFNQKEKIIQLGNPDELDTSHIPHSTTTLINSLFNKPNSFDTTAQAKWKQNAGITTGPDVVQSGTIGVGVSSYEEPKTPTDTSGTLLNDKMTSDSVPKFYYTVKAQATGRAESSVKVTVTVTTRLRTASSYFGDPYSLKGQIYIGGAWHPIEIKKSHEYWRGNSGHTSSITVIVGGLNGSVSELAGIKFKVERTDSTGGTAGRLPETACSNLPISPFEKATPDGYYLTSETFGSGEQWHGASVTRLIESAVNCKMIFSNGFAVGSGSENANQVGVFQVLLVNNSGSGRQIVAGLSLVKNSYGSQARVLYFIKNANVYEIEMDISKGNPFFKEGVSNIIEKKGDTFIFRIGGSEKQFRDLTLKDVPVTEVTFIFAKHSDKPQLMNNGLYSAKVIREINESYVDVKNVFTPNDSVVADCATGNIYRNGALEQNLGALGNDWEDFYLEKGMNQIGTAYSDFVAKGFEPDFKVKYREVFL